MNPSKPRIPGSQVAPGQKPFSRNTPTAATHSKITDADRDRLVANTEFAVIDKDGNVFGEHLTFADAGKLKEQVAAQRRSKTPKVVPQEDLVPSDETPIPDGEEDDWRIGMPSDTAAPIVDLTPEQLDALEYHAASSGTDTHPMLGTELAVLSVVAEVRRRRGEALAAMNTPNPDPQLESIRQRGLAAAAAAVPVPQGARKIPSQQHSDSTKRTTVPIPRPRPPAPPQDLPKPPPSPLTDKVIDDLPDTDLPEPDTAQVSEHLAGVGAATADDERSAKADAEADAELIVELAKDAYSEAVARDANPNSWPLFEKLGEFELAGWKYFAIHGGAPPALTKVMRKPQFAGVDPQEQA